MSINFRKRVTIFPGVTMNFGKKGMSVSVGPRGCKLTTGSHGTRISTSIPGTGIYATQKLGKSKKSTPQIQPSALQEPTLKSPEYYYGWGAIMLLLGIGIILYITLLSSSLSWYGEWITCFFGGLLIPIGIFFLGTAKDANIKSVLIPTFCYFAIFAIAFWIIPSHIERTVDPLYPTYGHRELYDNHYFAKFCIYALAVITSIITLLLAKMLKDRE